MNELRYWRNSEEAQEILKIVKEEILSHRKDILGGNLLLFDTNERIVRKYAQSLGVIQGLEFLENLLTDKEESESGQDNQR